MEELACGNEDDPVPRRHGLPDLLSFTPRPTEQQHARAALRRPGRRRGRDERQDGLEEVTLDAIVEKLLKECVSIQESLPFVAVDPLTPMDFLKIARFLNMVGLLAENLGCQTTKEYRFNFHHKYLEPTPQYFPFGFDVDVIRQARTVQEKPGIRYNEEEHPFTEELRAASEQFLKFVEKAAPIAVYTSGKGSSAAGLTASVTQDHATREFYLEGGAMVLADGGVACIDEFDEMRDQDCITTVLNSRTAVLAAANPTFGRYQEEKNAAEQVDFQSTILSRFDMIFILRDMFDMQKDQTLARHILKVHMAGGAAVDSELPTADIEISVLKRYVAYARQKCSPRLSEQAVARLESFYVKIRQEVQVAATEAEASGRAPRAVPITVRQLEAIIRIAESCAKMRLSEVATEDDVGTAIELFNVSTLQAARMGDIQLEGGGDGSEHSAEMQISQRVAIGATVSRRTLVGDLNAIGLDQAAVNRAINALVRRGDYQETSQGRKLRRLK